MEQAGINAMVAEPDAVLMREGEVVQRQLAFHTVPLFFFRGKADIGNCTGSGSGVLVKLEQKRFFILTAGHCVEQAGDAGNEIAVGIDDGPHRWIPMIIRRGRRHSEHTEQDFGYFEIPALDAGRVQAGWNFFASEQAIDIVLPEDLITKNDWMVISGFPGDIMTGDPQSRVGAGLLTYSTTIAGTGTSPPSSFPRQKNNYRVLDLHVARKGNINSTAEPKQEFSAPALSGASGGGCWLAGVRPDAEQWKPQNMRLVGIHIASYPVDEDNLFAREVLVGHHLRLIAEDCEDLREAMYKRWPNLGTFDL